MYKVLCMHTLLLFFFLCMQFKYESCTAWQAVACATAVAASAQMYMYMYTCGDAAYAAGAATSCQECCTSLGGMVELDN